MRIFIRLLVLFTFAVGLAIGARYNPGNIVVFFPPYRIDLSLNLAIIALLLLFVALHLALNTIESARRMPARVTEYRQGKRERDANKALRESIRTLFEGRFGYAEKAANRAAELPENRTIASLIGARAAHHMGQFGRRDQWLEDAAADVSHKVARLVTATELHVDQHDSEKALESVKELQANGSRHIQVLRWALKASQQARRWQDVLKLVKTLEKHHAIHPALAARLKDLSYEDLLKDHGHDGESLKRVWFEIPSTERKRVSIALHAAAAFNERGLFDEARGVVEKAMEEKWDERLLKPYRDAAAPEGSAALLGQIENCERWVAEHPSDAELALTLGTLCHRQKLWGKAQRHFEQAIDDAIAGDTLREANLKLAQLFDSLGQEEDAARCYKRCALATTL